MIDEEKGKYSARLYSQSMLLSGKALEESAKRRFPILDLMKEAMLGRIKQRGGDMKESITEREQQIDYTRQSDIIDMTKVLKSSISLVGCGAIGSWTAPVLAKMGVSHFDLYDGDNVSLENIPNQFYDLGDIGRPKALSLRAKLINLSNCKTSTYIRHYVKERLRETVIVCTDSMASRRLVWNQFLKQKQCRTYIEARMGGEVGIVYLIRDKKKDRKFYEETLYSDEKAVPQRCTAKAIMYNVSMIAALIGRAWAASIRNEKIPREMVFSMVEISTTNWMVRK